MTRVLFASAFLLASATAALADIPIDDAEQLTQKVQTSALTTTLVPVQQKQRDGQKGIDCATHTGQKGAVQNNTATPNSSSAAAAVQSYAPQLSTTPAANATGSTLATQNLVSAAGDVVAGNMATQAAIVSNGPTYQNASSLIGGSATIMAGYDQNSSGGTQNGVSWNQVLATANLLVSAYNAINMMRVSQASQAARGMSFTSFASGTGYPSNAICGVGYRGDGTANNPCILASSQFCQSLLDGGCVERHITDSLGHVVIYLERDPSH
ncbi:hypothetical protein [Methylocystis iwaonis]|uniref:hypothetical protein n=1 Tax=Methylocystis iwaonis TaxID=2885079 RepID=UPI002E7AD4EB|nr:hypothetical protein [Methylocystis iwaonis]